MAFSFAIPQQGYQAPDYLLRAQAGLPLDPSTAGLAAPMPPPAAAPPAAPAMPDIPVSTGEAMLSWLAHGGTPAEAAQSARAVKVQNMRNAYAIQQSQMLMDALRSAPPDARMAMLFNPSETGKAYADRLQTHTLRGGETLTNGGPGGAPFTATSYGMDNGVGYALGPNVPGGLALSSERAPGETKVDAESGGFYNNNGPIARQQFTRWRTFEPTQTAGPAFAGVRGAVPGFPVQGGLPAGPLQLGTGVANASAPPAPNAAATVATNAPRGVRNNNFGNLMALPNGHQWAGQVGVDPGGYAVFATPQDGVNAATTNLQSYATKHGINTVAGVVSRWAPAGSNNTSNYIHYVAGSMGVDPNQPLNMSDPNVQNGLMNGIFAFENGPRAMAALSGQAQPPATQGVNATQPASAAQAQPGDTAPSFNAVHQGQLKRPLTSPAERAANGIDPNDKSPYVLGPNGIERRGENMFGPSQQLDYTKTVTAMEPYKNYTMARQYVAAMQDLMKQPGGFADLSLIENAGKTINPTVAIRPNMIEQYGKETGWPDWLVGEISSTVNHGGHLTQEGRNALLNIAATNLQSHWMGVQPILKKVDHDATKYGVTREDLIPDLVPMPDKPSPSYPDARVPHSPQGSRQQAPQGVQLPAGIPPVAQRKPGVYQTPRGPMMWSGTGWRPTGGR